MYAWDIPLYSPTMAGRLVGLQPERVRRWIQGYRYAYSVKSKKEIQLGQKKPVVSRKDKGEKYASFLKLIDLLLVKEFAVKYFKTAASANSPTPAPLPPIAVTNN